MAAMQRRNIAMSKLVWDNHGATTALAVLISGGLDSAILLGEAIRQSPAVHPLYLRTGLHWEDVELRWLRRYLKALDRKSLQPLEVLDLPVTDLYGQHWSITGKKVPNETTPDEAVFLPGRNVLLLAKGMLWCHLHGVPALALGHLGSNPFPDATPEFIRDYQRVVNEAIGGRVVIQRPYAKLDKTAVMHRGMGLPLELTFSCIRPVGDQQCGRCAERRRAFADAGMTDPTKYYHETRPCTA